MYGSAQMLITPSAKASRVFWALAGVTDTADASINATVPRHILICMFSPKKEGADELPAPPLILNNKL